MRSRPGCSVPCASAGTPIKIAPRRPTNLDRVRPASARTLKGRRLIWLSVMLLLPIIGGGVVGLVREQFRPKITERVPMSAVEAAEARVAELKEVGVLVELGEGPRLPADAGRSARRRRCGAPRSSAPKLFAASPRSSAG